MTIAFIAGEPIDIPDLSGWIIPAKAVDPVYAAIDQRIREHGARGAAMAAIPAPISTPAGLLFYGDDGYDLARDEAEANASTRSAWGMA